MSGPIGREMQKCLMTYSQQLGREVVELNVQIDHVYLLVKVPPKLSISELMGVLKGRTAIRKARKSAERKVRKSTGVNKSTEVDLAVVDRALWLTHQLKLLSIIPH